MKCPVAEVGMTMFLLKTNVYMDHILFFCLFVFWRVVFFLVCGGEQLLFNKWFWYLMNIIKFEIKLIICLWFYIYTTYNDTDFIFQASQYEWLMVISNIEVNFAQSNHPRNVWEMSLMSHHNITWDYESWLVDTGWGNNNAKVWTCWL